MTHFRWPVPLTVAVLLAAVGPLSAGDLYPGKDPAPSDSRNLVQAMAGAVNQRLTAAGVPSSSQYGTSLGAASGQADYYVDMPQGQ